jgi:hypothetical protein
MVVNPQEYPKGHLRQPTFGVAHFTRGQTGNASKIYGVHSLRNDQFFSLPWTDE